MAAVIGAPRQNVWRALTDPAEGETVRWRYKLGSVSLVLKETPQIVQPQERYALGCSAGSLHFEEAFTLVEEPEDTAQAARTRVSLKLVASNRIQLIGADIDRFEVRRMLNARIGETLRSLQKWCES